MTIAAVVEADANPPRVRITTDQETVTRDAGDGPVAVRGVVMAGVIYDYECPQEVPVTYAAGAATVAVEMPNVGDWLVHLTQPELSQRITFGEHPDWTSPLALSAVDIPGRGTVSVSFGPRTGDRGGFTAKTYTVDEYRGLRELLVDGSVLFLSTHLEVGFGPAYLAVGDVQWNRTQNMSADQSRIAAIPYFEVERPEWVANDGLTWADLGTTWGALEPTWDGLVRG